MIKMKTAPAKSTLNNPIDDDQGSVVSSSESEVSFEDSKDRRSSETRREDVGAPEVLVRRENRVISVVRVVVILVLISAASSTGVFIYHFTRDAELESFKVAFEGKDGRSTLFNSLVNPRKFTSDMGYNV